ncbi:hypothetical protein [Lujinxingia litoralis]|uniref:hypothetical protein n=1 Tax=Lujinxingia litoralis TaxID=2211119 RepID=UPI0011B946A6|nr:hypothetical protein [Lujinxingia litoralis]
MSWEWLSARVSSSQTATKGGVDVSGKETVFRLNYGLEWMTDLVGNSPERGMLVQLGLATYF